MLSVLSNGGWVWVYYVNIAGAMKDKMANCQCCGLENINKPADHFNRIPLLCEYCCSFRLGVLRTSPYFKRDLGYSQEWVHKGAHECCPVSDPGSAKRSQCLFGFHFRLVLFFLELCKGHILPACQKVPYFTVCCIVF